MKILNHKGEEVVLNAVEQGVVDYLQNQLSAPHIKNALGYEVDVTTLTGMIKSISEQKFFEIAPAEFMPVKVGEGAWSTNLVKFRSFAIADDFETGIVNTGASNSKLAEADAGVDSVTIEVNNWAKSIGWSLMDLAHASKSGNWDLITSKERSRKKNWDLGIQKTAFLGSTSKPDSKGLLTQTDVNSNTTTITQYIKEMSASEFNTFVQIVYADYRKNCLYTARPTHFLIPEEDYNGLVSYPDSSYPLKTKLELLEQAFKTITRNPNFKILPCAYADEDNNEDVTGLDKNRYALYNYDEDSLRMNIPVDYTATIANSINGFQFNNVGYGQFTGCKAYRPKEMLYFDWATA